MVLFTGEFVYAIDSQRRVAVPREWRDKGADGIFYILPGRHNSLALVTPTAYADMFASLSKSSFANPEESRALANFGAMARECRCDKQGRIAIPERLLEHCQVKRGAEVDAEIVLIGAVSTIQIWSVKNWEKQRLPEDAMLDVIQKVSERPGDRKVS